MASTFFIAMTLIGIMPPSINQIVDSPRPGRAVRFATFNASLNREKAGDLARDLAAPGNAQARNVAEIIQRTRPDVLLINEFDHDPDGRAAVLFQDNYLSV